MRRTGVARWDVVIALLIVFTVGGLLFVAVQRAREKEATRQTLNNLKQCALAIHSFHDNYKMFPHAFSPGGIFANKEFSLWFHLRPFSESSSFYTNASLNEVVPVYVAPSDKSHFDSAGALSFAANLRVFGHATFLKNAQPVDQPGRSSRFPREGSCPACASARLPMGQNRPSS